MTNSPEYLITLNGVKTAHIEYTRVPGFCPGCGYELKKKVSRSPMTHIFSQETGQKIDPPIESDRIYYECPNLHTYPWILEDPGFDWSKFEDIKENIYQEREKEYRQQSIRDGLIFIPVIIGICWCIYKIIIALI